MLKKLKSLKDTLVNLALDNKVQSVSRFAGQILETIYYTDTSNPVSIGSALISLWNTGVESFELELSKLDRFVEVNKLKTHNGNLIEILEKSGVFKDYPPTVIIREEYSQFVKIEFPFGNLYALKSQDELDKFIWISLYYSEAGFDFEKLFEVLWAKFPNGIYVPKIKELTDSMDYMVNFIPLETKEMHYIGSNPSLEDTHHDLVLFKQKGISRSFLLSGPPGTGKTAFCISLAKKFSSRIIKMDPSSLQFADASYVEFILEQLKPDFVVFDDFEQLERQGALLFTVENLKQKYPKVTIFATVNNIGNLDKALLRPGRFDEILYFEPSKDNKKILEFYSDKFGLALSKQKVTSLASAAEGLSGAYLKELCLRIQVQGIDKADDIVKKLKNISSAKEE